MTSFKMAAEIQRNLSTLPLLISVWHDEFDTLSHALVIKDQIKYWSSDKMADILQTTFLLNPISM